MKLFGYFLLIPTAVALAQAPANPPTGVCSIPLLNMRPSETQRAAASDNQFTIPSPKPSSDGKQLLIVNVKPPAPPCTAPELAQPQPAAPAAPPAPPEK